MKQHAYPQGKWELPAIDINGSVWSQIYSMCKYMCKYMLFWNAQVSNLRNVMRKLECY